LEEEPGQYEARMDDFDEFICLAFLSSFPGAGAVEMASIARTRTYSSGMISNPYWQA
jgi:hypothetical protein